MFLCHLIDYCFFVDKCDEKTPLMRKLAIMQVFKSAGVVLAGIERSPKSVIFERAAFPSKSEAVNYFASKVSQQVSFAVFAEWLPT